MAKKPKKVAAAEAAVPELQNAPSDVAREEAKHAADMPATASRRKPGPKPGKKRAQRKAAAAAPAKRLGRPKGSKNKPKPAAAKVGRPKGSKNKLKAPAKRMGRPKGSKNKPKVASINGAARRGPGRPPKASASGLGQINQVVKRMVEERTRVVLGEAIAALRKAQAAVEKAM